MICLAVVRIHHACTRTRSFASGAELGKCDALELCCLLQLFRSHVKESVVSMIPIGAMSCLRLSCIPALNQMHEVGGSWQKVTVGAPFAELQAPKP
jgi:hypothetical protein